MRRALAALAAALALAACDRDGAKPAAEPDAAALASPRLSGRLYTCDLSYIAVRGPLVSQSRASVRMSVDTGPLTPGWKVESVTVREPLPDAQGFDPWLQFLPGVSHRFFGQQGSVVTLAMAEGAPVTFDLATGDLNWSKEGPLGETEYTGGCF
jgi:hypothetical protein